MKFLLPVILAVVGLSGGLFGGHFLQPAKPPPEEVEADAEPPAEEDLAMKSDDGGDAPYKAPPPQKREPVNTEFVKMDKQFVVPVIEGGRVASLMVLSLAIEVLEGQGGLVFDHEPKLRDELLQALFVHAQSGGFSGEFTRAHLMQDLKDSLGSAAVSVLGNSVQEVLLTNIVRQDQ